MIIDNQKRYLKDWNARLAADFVLQSAEPWRYWSYLLDLGGNSAGEVVRRVEGWKKRAWVPLANGKVISPDSLISLDRLNLDILELSASCGYAYASVAAISPEVMAHANVHRLLDCVATGDDALSVLGQMMSEAGLSVGRQPGASYGELQRHLAVLSRSQCIKAWGLIERAIAATGETVVADRLVPEIQAPISLEVATAALNELPKLASGVALIEIAECYLKEWRDSAPVDELKLRLFSLMLPNEAGVASEVGMLVSGVFGVEAESLIHHRLAPILKGVAVENGTHPANSQSGRLEAANEGATDELISRLEEIFEPLESSEIRQWVGAVMGLCGDSAKVLARRWWGDIAYEDYLEKLGWSDPGHIQDGRDKKLDFMGGRSVGEAMQAVRCTVSIGAESKVTVVNLLGAQIDVPLLPLSAARTLLAGPIRWIRNDHPILPIRRVDSIIDLDISDQKAILENTAEAIWREVFNQKRGNLTGVFELFSAAEQVTLSVARDLILEGLAQSLRTLRGVTRHSKLSVALSDLDEARQDAASAKQARRKGDDFEEKVRRARKALATLVESDPEVQRVVLEAVKERVGHNQYELSSIPFEIFQNADDAVTEFQLLQAEEGRPAVDANLIGRFVMRADDGTVRFMHWGRPINYAGRHATARREFGYDLERMLMLGASSKRDDDGVTGKFGLGFKSTLLASNSPRIWSGTLRFEVVAGCIPRKWTGGEETQNWYQNEQRRVRGVPRGTLVELELARAETGAELASRFGALVGLMPAFSKSIRRIEVDGHLHQWQPQTLLTRQVGQLEVGVVTIPAKGGSVQTRMLVVRTAIGAAAFRMTSEGAGQFDQGGSNPIPAIWVTVPTRGSAAHGVILNADFQIDTGRATLARGKASDRNRDLATSLAASVAPMLAEMQRQSESDWMAFSDALACKDLPNACEFWFRWWKSTFGIPPGADASDDIALTDSFACELFRRMVELTGYTPNGLGGFAVANDLSVSIDIDRLKKVVTPLGQWEAFLAKYPKGCWCAQDVGGWLARAALVGRVGQICELDRALVVGALHESRISPDDVIALAAVIGSWPQGLTEDQGWKNELSTTLIRTKAGTWMHPSRVLRHGEAMLAAFAPEGVRADDAYFRHGSSFQMLDKFLPACTLDAGLVAGWCLAAVAKEARISVVSWLAGNLNSPVVDMLKNRRQNGGWIYELDLGDPLLSGLSPTDGVALLAKLGANHLQPSPDPVPQCPPSFDLETLHRWWMEKGDSLLRTYDENLWPLHIDKERLSMNPIDRSAWMTLFSLGLFRRFGRVTDAQNRGFLSFLERKNWWNIICSVSPNEDPASWIAILEEYCQNQQVEPLFEQWMDSFPRLFRVARWLDEYVHLFTTLDLRKPGELERLLSPAADASLSGSGIDAPTLSSMLRRGQYLVIRELLRAGILSSETAKQFAYNPSEKVLRFFDDLGFSELRTSRDIRRMLVDELGADAACFGGAYDIPLLLVAGDEVIRRSLEQWADAQFEMET